MLHDLAIDIEVGDHFIALNLVNQMQLKMEPHPDPYRLDDHGHVRHRCKVHFRVKSYEDEIWCDVVDLHS